MKLKVDVLSLNSVSQAVKELEQYKNSLDAKNKIFVNRLVDIAKKAIEERVNAAGYTVSGDGIQSGSDTSHKISDTIMTQNHRTTATVKLYGAEVLFIEFGAGVYHNGGVGGSPNPKGVELGMTIGSYGDGHGKKDVWGYTDENGELVLTHGTKATMPMFYAMEAIQNNYIRVAKEVFGV